MKKVHRPRSSKSTNLTLSRKVRPELEFLEDRTLPAAPVFVPNELLVQYRPDVDASTRAALRNYAHATLAEQIQTRTMAASGQGVLERWTLPKGLNVSNAIALMSVNSVVAYAEPNWVYQPEVIPNDPSYQNGSQWDMYSDDLPTAVGPAGTTNQYGTQAEKAWNANYTGSSSVFVGVIDEGIQYTHPELVNNVFVNPYDPKDGIDNDGNGYTDDVNGWDFFNNDNTIYDGPTDDHGTHVAGTIGAQGNNKTGIAGTNWSVTMISAKFLGPSGGTTAGAIRALDYLTDMKTRHNLNLVTTSNSWGGGGFSQGLLDAITRSAQAGILFVAAAGNSNSNNDVTGFYPANYNTTAGAGYDSVIAVASITSTGARSSFSSYGATTVDLGAPGSGILLTVPTSTYAYYDGTSMATPHVSGAAALYASVYPGVTAQQIRAAILNGVTPTPSLAGITVTGGRLNIWDTLNIAPPTTTISVNDVSVTEGNIGTTPATFTVTLSQPSTQTVTVDFTTSDGTALSTEDYTRNFGTLTFRPGETSKTISVDVIGDTNVEPDETFFLTLSNATNATLFRKTGTGTILNDDTIVIPIIRIDDVTVVEGDTGVTGAIFTVSLSDRPVQVVSASFTTTDGTATALDRDYTPTSGKLTFQIGEISKVIRVDIIGDTKYETDENFTVDLSGVTNATVGKGVGLGTITNDDPVPLPVITIDDLTYFEGNTFQIGIYAFQLTLSAPSTDIVSVSYAASDGTATGADHDYQLGAGTVYFAPGQTVTYIYGFVFGDLKKEPDEYFLVKLLAADKATIGRDFAVGNILNDD